MIPEAVREKLAAITARHQSKRKKRRWYHRNLGLLKHALSIKGRSMEYRHHPCAKLGTAAKNTHRNPNNIRASKSLRPECRFQKLRAFKLQYGIS